MSILIDLMKQHFIHAVHHGCKRFRGIDERAVYGHFHIQITADISGQRFGFNHAEGAIGYFFKGGKSVFIRQGTHDDRSNFVHQAKLHALHWQVVFVVLEDAETGEVIPNDSNAGDMAVLIHGKGEHVLAEFTSFWGVYLAEGVGAGRNRDVCDFTVFICNITEDDITICILHFDGSTG